MTNSEATAIFTLASHICGRQVVEHAGELPDESAVEHALVHLVERARKHLMVGPTPAKVRELWAQRATPAASSSDLVDRLRSQLDAVIFQATHQANEIRETLEDLEGGEDVVAALEQSLEQLEELETVRRCRSCGCTELTACEGESGPCGWAGDDLCTFCVSP